MLKSAWKMVPVLGTLLALVGCSGENKLEVDLQVRLDGKPAPAAQVRIDGVAAGVTDAVGNFLIPIERKPGTEVVLTVLMELPGHRIEPWQDSFVVKVPAERGAPDRYSFLADLQSVKFITFAVTGEGVPLPGARIAAGKVELGKSDQKGELLYEFDSLPEKGVNVSVASDGYAPWKQTITPQPGDRVDVALSRQAILEVAALTEEYGLVKGLRGVAVSIDGKTVGKTDGNGHFTYLYTGEPGRKVNLALAHAGFNPPRWQSAVVLDGNKSVERYFYPAALKPVRVGLYGYGSNVPDAELGAELARIEEAVANNLFSYPSFSKVPQATLLEKMKSAKVRVEEIPGKGWQKSSLLKTVDLLVLGSVGRSDAGYLIETKVYGSDGRLLLSQINTAGNERGLVKTAQQIAEKIVATFPFEGAVVAADGERFQINLGKHGYKIGRGMEFALLTASENTAGKITGYREVGTLKVKSVGQADAWTEAVELAAGGRVSVGDKVVRRLLREEDSADGSFLTIAAQGGLPPDISPLRGVNVYLDDLWIGTTGADGKARIPAKPGKKYDLILYRHGYQQVREKLRFAASETVKEFTLTVNNALLRVESEPAGAEVLIDGASIGRTPILDGRQVNFGFHTVRIAAEGEYRDWEEVVEFNRKVEERTGANRIVLLKDYLKIGGRLEAAGDLEGAIVAYGGADRRHPDYAFARQKLARLYMDEKGDYGAAIREFENALSLPETRDLIYKQFSVTYSNLGHAYYERGNGQVRQNSEAAAQDLAKAIQNLEKARQNTRFFPAEHYDEGLHDTYYYLALSYHKLYLLTRKPALLDKADLAWRQYFDFFPKSLEGQTAFVEIRDGAQKHWTQLQDLR